MSLWLDIKFNSPHWEVRVQKVVDSELGVQSTTSTMVDPALRFLNYFLPTKKQTFVLCFIAMRATQTKYFLRLIVFSFKQYLISKNAIEKVIYFLLIQK